jgi:hypothetical protein
MEKEKDLKICTILPLLFYSILASRESIFINLDIPLKYKTQIEFSQPLTKRRSEQLQN